MAEYTLRITVKIPDEIPQEKVVEWARFVTGYTNFLPADNPLKDIDLEAVACSVSGTYRIHAPRWLYREQWKVLAGQCEKARDELIGEDFKLMKGKPSDGL